MTKDDDILVRGTAGVMPAPIILHLAENYPLNLSALLELTDNAIDARKGPKVNIFVILEDGTITIIDDGVGMVPEMTAGDLEKLNRFKERAQRGKVAAHEDVRDELSEASRGSMRYLAESIGFSGKKGAGLIGRHGVGFWGHLKFSKAAVVISRPAHNLAKQLWPRVKPGSEPTYRLVTQSYAQLVNHDLGYQIERDPRSLHDPWGRTLPHGTRIELTLKEGAQGTFQPGGLVTSLGSRYAGRIHSGEVIITVVDRVTAQGKAKRGGLELRVSPPAYLGTELLRQTYFLSRGKNPFEVHIRYDETGNSSPVQLRILGIDQCHVTEITALKPHAKLFQSPMTGYIELPDDPSIPLNTRKNRPQENTPGLSQWEQKILTYVVPNLQQQIADHEERIGSRRLETYGKAAAQVINEALQSLPAFSDITFQEMPPSKKATRKKQTERSSTRTTAMYIRATVMDQHKRGIQGVKVTLRRGNDVDTIPTGLGGGVWFGKRPNGIYTISIQLPPNTTAVSRTEYRFQVSDEKPGYGAVFEIKTKDPKTPKTSSFRHLAFQPLTDPTRLFDDSRIGLGVLVMNSIAGPVAIARDLGLQQGNWEELDALVATCAALALAKAQFPDDVDRMLNQAAWLDWSINDILTASRRKRKAKVR